MSYSDDLPHTWRRPAMVLQKTLFPCKTAEMLAHARVSMDEALRWLAYGWLSFDPRACEELDEPELFELVFVRNIARSGLSDEQIGSWLGELPKPFRYDPSRIAYSFAYGWIECPSEVSVEDLSESDIEAWIESQALLGERGVLLRMVAMILKSLPEEEDKG